MSPDLDALLCARYSALFIHRHDDTGWTSIHEGICVGDGWFDLVDDLCSGIQAIVTTGAIQPVVIGIDQHRGSLRFRLQKPLLHLDIDARIRTLIMEASRRSATICDVCAPRDCGRMTARGAMPTLLRERIHEPRSRRIAQRALPRVVVERRTSWIRSSMAFNSYDDG